MMSYNESLAKILNYLIGKIGYDADVMYNDLKDEKIGYGYTPNIIQFLKIVKVPCQGSKDGIPYEFNIANYLEAKLFNSGISVWKSLSRQNYSTMNHICLLIYDLIYKSRSGFIIAKNKEDYRLIISKMEFIIDHLPEDITLYTFVNKSNIKNYFEYIKLESEQEAWELIERAESERRNIMIDNAEFIPHIYPIIDRMIISKYNFLNTPVQVLASTVINDNAEDKLITTIDSLYEVKDIDYIVRTIFGQIESNFNIVRLHYNYKDLLLDESWAENMKKLLNNDEDIYRREVLLERKQKED